MQWTGLWSNTVHSLAGTFGARAEVPVRDGSQRGPRWGSPAMAFLLCQCPGWAVVWALGHVPGTCLLAAGTSTDHSQSIASWRPGRV